MKSRFNLLKRAGVYYNEDTVTRKQHSLRTKDETEALVILLSNRPDVAVAFCYRSSCRADFWL